MVRSNPTVHQVSHSEDAQNPGELHSLGGNFLCHQLRKRQQNPTLKANCVLLSQVSSQLVNPRCDLPPKTSGEAVLSVLGSSAGPDVTDTLN